MAGLQCEAPPVFETRGAKDFFDNTFTGGTSRYAAYYHSRA